MIVFEDERATVWCGDALAVLAELETGSVDAVISDPPYSSGGMVRGDRVQATTLKYSGAEVEARTDFTGDSRDQRSYAYWSALWLGEARRVTRPGGVLLCFTDWRQLPATSDAVQAGGWVWRGIVPWFKPVARPQLGRFTSACEYVVWASNGGMPVEGPVLPGFYQYAPPRQREHITQKPVELMADLLRIVPPGGVVLDPFLGSGTTGVAAMHGGFRFVGVEMLPHFAEVAARRIQEAQGRAVDRGDQTAFDLTGVVE